MRRPARMIGADGIAHRRRGTAEVMGFAPALLSLALAGQPITALAQPVATASERLHANALASFRQGRFPEAYGRLGRLADAGHAPSAALALWMYCNRLTVFGRDWDITPDQMEDWLQLARQPAWVTTTCRASMAWPREGTASAIETTPKAVHLNR